MAQRVRLAIPVLSVLRAQPERWEQPVQLAARAAREPLVRRAPTASMASMAQPVQQVPQAQPVLWARLALSG